MLFDGGMQHSVNFDSFLFNQGPNGPKFHGNPQHFMFALHSSVFLHSLPYNCTVSFFFFNSKLSAWEFNISVFLFSGALTKHLHVLCSFLPQPANQKAASGAGRLPGEGGDPDVSAVCQREFVHFKKTPSQQPTHLHNNLLSESFYAYRSSGRKSLRRPLIPFLCAGSHCART